MKICIVPSLARCILLTCCLFGWMPLQTFGAAGVVGGGSSGGSGGGGGGSVTNLTPFAANLGLEIPATYTLTNTPTLVTNWTTATSANLPTDISGTNGWIRTTNAGYYLVSLAVTYRSITNGQAIRTNEFLATTNVGGVGLTSTKIGFLSFSQGNTNYYTGAASGMIYCPSNTYFALGGQQANGAPTNAVSIERASLSVTLVPGSLLGSLAANQSRAITNSAATNFSLIWPGPDIVVLAPTANQTITMTEAGAPAAGSAYQRKDLFILTDQTIIWPPGWKTRDGRSPGLAAGMTNRVVVEFDGTNVIMEAMQTVVSEYGVTKQYPSAVLTNHWADFSADLTQIDATNNVHFIERTNQPSGRFGRFLSVMVNTFGRGGTTTLSFNTNRFSLLGVTNYVNLRSNTIACVNFANVGGTNVGVTYAIQSEP